MLKKSFFLIFFIFFALSFSFSKTEKKEKEEKVLKEKVIVTATAVKEDPLNIIDSFCLLSQEEIERFKPINLTEALSYSFSNISLTSGTYGQFSSVFLRGASSKHFALLINGIKLNDPAALSLDFSPFSANIFQQIEIINGPQASLYGSEAMGGVINLITRSREGLSFSIYGGKNASYGGFFSFGKKNGNNSLYFSYSGNKIKGDLENSDFYGNNFLLNWEHKRDFFSFSPFLYFVDSETEIPFNMGYPSPERKTKSNINVLALPLKFKIKSRGFLDVKLSYYGRNYTLKDPQAFWGKYYHTKSRNFQVNTKVVYSIFEKNSPSILGFEILKSEVSEENEFGKTFDEEKYDFFAVFVEQVLKYGGLNAVGGIRYDKYKNIESCFSPKFSFSYRFSLNKIFISPYFVISKGFRAPKVSEYASPWGSKDLKPEHSLNYEGGLKIAGEKVLFSFSRFLTDYEELIVFDFSTYKLKNSEKDRIEGFSSSFQYFFGKNIFSISFTKMDAKNKINEKPLLRRPSYSVKGSFFLVFGKLSFTMSIRYVGKRKDYDEKNFSIVDAESFSVFNFNVNYKVSEKVSFFLKVNNLFDRDYYEIYGYPSPKRWLFGGIEFKY